MKQPTGEQQFHLTLEEIVKPEYEPALARAEERIAQAIVQASSTKKPDRLTELISFPLANMFVIGIGEDYLDKRYALSESARAYRLLMTEKPDFILELARGEFGWLIERSDKILDGHKSNFKILWFHWLWLSSLAGEEVVRDPFP